MNQFRFGTGISSYQVEGDRTGRDSCIWDDFCLVKGNIKDKTDGNTAIDFNHRYKEDLQYAKELGIQDFRFSISWPRVIKDNGSVNEEGLDFYSDLVDEIIKDGMNPVVTIFHWDLPSILMKKGGFTNRSIITDFIRFVQVLSKKLSQRVTDWITFNEPQCFIGIGYQKRGQAPKIDCDYITMAKAAHNVLLCHSHAYQILKKDNPNCTVSFVNTFNVPLPYGRGKEEMEKELSDILFSIPKSKEEFYTLSIYSDPLYIGSYPKEYSKKIETSEIIQKGDMELIQKSKPDYLCLNIYTGTYYRKNKEEKTVIYEKKTESEKTDLPWLLRREKSIYYGCKYLYGRYKTPIIITENGGCYHDRLLKNKVIHDKERSQYLKKYLHEAKRCIKEGIDIRGYYYWSLFDNFEWEWGESKRFGLVYIDYKDNLKRYKKDSFYTYQRIIKKSRS